MSPPAARPNSKKWFQHEHLAGAPRRAGISARTALRGGLGPGRNFFNLANARSAEVLKSPAYLARLDDPTPMTRIVMAEIFKDMIRTVLPSYLPRRDHARLGGRDGAVQREAG